MGGWTTVLEAQRAGSAERCDDCGHRGWYHGQRGCWVRVNLLGAGRRECGCRHFTPKAGSK